MRHWWRSSCWEDNFSDGEDTVEAVDGEIHPLFKPPRWPSRVHRTPEHYRNEERETSDGRVVKTVRKLERLWPLVKPGLLSECKHKSMHAGDEEVKPKGPEGKVCEEAEGLPDRGVGLLNRIAADVYVLKIDRRSVVGEPCIAYGDSYEAVQAQDCAYAGKNQRRDEL